LLDYCTKKLTGKYRGFHSLLLITVFLHFTSFYIVPGAFRQLSVHQRLID